MTTCTDKRVLEHHFRCVSGWTQVGENLVRHWAGQIYLRAKVDGKVKRVSLQTSDLRIAKMKRDDLLSGMRKASASEHQTGAVRTLGEAIGVRGRRFRCLGF